MKNITLEMSLKPFKQTNAEYIQEVCHRVFEQWRPLIKDKEIISILLWTSDGSELLDYNGKEEDAFEWAYFLGDANHFGKNNQAVDPDSISLHTTSYLYMENPPVMTYGILKSIVACLKAEGKKMYPQATIRVGTTLDPGPEFAISDFKYHRHNEVCTGTAMGQGSFLCAYATLNGDNRSYAAYPDGIPDGTPFGTFMGKQAQVFMTDMGFDYIWLSNGLGFGREPWHTKGAVFDGEHFDYNAFEGVKEKVFEFWDTFRKECPDYPIETRGTNMSMGVDLATDGVPLKDIYEKVDGLLPPPNSPWAALNEDFGLELAGHMSRIAEIPGEEYLFRYYLHDPWWVNTPWYDRYNSNPHDIYLPMAIARVDKNGKIQSPTQMNFLSIDNSYGNMPDSCVNEPMPHLIKAIKEAPDMIGPVVWVYPFDEYSSCSSEREIAQMFSEDWYMRNVVNAGVPINTVVSTRNFVEHDMSIYSTSILITPVPKADSVFEKHILDYVSDGGNVIFYGDTSLASQTFLDFIGVRHGKEISGELPVVIEGKPCGKILHNPVVSGGGIVEESTTTNVLAEVTDKTIGTFGDHFVWLRATNAADYTGGQLLQAHDERQYFKSERLMRKALSMFGFKIEYEKPLGQREPVMTIHRNNGAYWFTVYQPSTTVKTRLRFPWGVPVLDSHSALMEDGYAVYHFGKAVHRECRVFVEQKSGVVSCRELGPVSYQYRRRIAVEGLEDATVRFLAETYCKDNVHVVLNSHRGFYSVSELFEGSYVTIDGQTFYEAKHVTGQLVFSMPDMRH